MNQALKFVYKNLEAIWNEIFIFYTINMIYNEEKLRVLFFQARYESIFFIF